MNIAGYSTPGPRPVNEDSYYLLDFSEYASFFGGVSAFIMVSDGMGGHEGGDVASQLAAQAAERYIGQLIEMAKSNQIELDIPFALKEIVRNANEAILQEMESRGNASMGATFVGAFLSPRKAWIAHVGDSRAYLIRRGVVSQLTKDHSAVGRLLSEGLITEKEAQNHPQRNVIERALGFTTEDPEITETVLGRGDGLLLCSDGVSTVVKSETLADCVMRAASVDEAVEDVVNTALASDTDDNATTVIAVPNWSNMKVYAPKESTSKRFLARFGFGSKAGAKKSSVPLIAFTLVFVLCVGAALTLLFTSGNGGGGALPVPAGANEVVGAEENAPGAAATNETATDPDPSSSREYKQVGGQTELKYLDANEEAKNFYPEVHLKEGVSVLVESGPAEYKVAGQDNSNLYFLLAYPPSDLTGILDEENLNNAHSNSNGFNDVVRLIVSDGALVE